MRQRTNCFSWFTSLATTVAMLLLAGCSDDNDLPEPVPCTILVYMVADNSMDKEVEYALEQMKQGAAKSEGGTVVYLDRQNEAPRLFYITADGKETPLKVYEEENSACAETLARVIKETKELVPAKRYGLVYWSHSMGWLPQNHAVKLKSETLKAATGFPRTRYVGTDEHPGDGTNLVTVMEIDDMVNSLHDNGLEYIWFDVCLMGSIEALYELRNKCRYLVASPTEVMMEASNNASGIPFAKIRPYLSGDETDLKEACRIYCNHYRENQQEVLRSATITLVDAAQLEGLYHVASAILRGRLEAASTLDVNGLQAYHQGNMPSVFFDLGEVIKRLSTDGEYASFREQLDRTVLYKEATEQFINLPIDPGQFSGLSCYIPLSKWQGNTEYDYYFTLGWSGVYKVTR